MNKLTNILALTITGLLIISSCSKKGCTDPKANNYDAEAKKDDGSCVLPTDTNTNDSTPTAATYKVKFVFKFDSTQERLDNFGQPSTVPAGNSAQHPRFNLMGAHYIEFTESEYTALGAGEIVYNSPTTMQTGTKAFIFDSAATAENNEQFFEYPIDSMTPGTYKYLRVSLIYQNYDIDFTANGYDLSGTLASFVGTNSYISSFKIKDSTLTLNTDKAQGYWAFETNFTGVPVSQGQAPGTTVPNPISGTSPIPTNSCVATGIFATPLQITGNETSDITIVCSISINNSFEWKDANGNGKYEPLDGDTVVDMGVRGLIPIVQ